MEKQREAEAPAARQAGTAKAEALLVARTKSADMMLSLRPDGLSTGDILVVARTKADFAGEICAPLYDYSNCAGNVVIGRGSVVWVVML